MRGAGETGLPRGLEEVLLSLIERRPGEARWDSKEVREKYTAKEQHRMKKQGREEERTKVSCSIQRGRATLRQLGGREK